MVNGMKPKDNALIMTLFLHQISLGWPNKPLIDGFSLTIPKGKITVLQGPSGCGKSTLLSAVAGTNEASLSIKGDILLDDRLLNHLPPQERRIAILFQESLLFPHLTVAQNLGFGLPSGYSKAQRNKAILQALDDAGLADYGDYDPAHLSGGQKARIAMMRAMLSEPQVLLMDESFASLDPALRAQFGQFVATQIAARQIPALLISHHDDDKAFATGEVMNWPHQREN